MSTPVRGRALLEMQIRALLADDEAEARRCLDELRALVEEDAVDGGEVDEPRVELRVLAMSALLQLHRWACERGDDGLGEQLLAEAELELAACEASPLARGGDILRLLHVQMLMDAHVRAGDCRRLDRTTALLARAREQIRHAQGSIAMTEVLGQMLVNTHVDGDAVDDDQSQDARRRARAALQELRDLARTHPESAALQRHMATALFNAHFAASRHEATEEAEALLVELEKLRREYPESLELRRRLTMALVNHHGDVLDVDDHARAAAALARIRELAADADADDHLRLQLAMALSNALSHVEDAGSDLEGARIIGELRVLVARADASETLRALVLDELSERFAPQQ